MYLSKKFSIPAALQEPRYWISVRLELINPCKILLKSLIKIKTDHIIEMKFTLRLIGCKLFPNDAAGGPSKSMTSCTVYAGSYLMPVLHDREQRQSEEWKGRFWQWIRQMWLNC